MNLPSPDQYQSFQVRRLFHAPRERVFRAWIEPEKLQQWFRPAGTEIVISQLEAHVGGSFQFETTGSDGTHTVTTGKYLEIKFPEKLVFTWTSDVTTAKETLVTVEFIEQGMSTEVILTHDRLVTGTAIEFYRQGWTSLLDQLADVVLSLT